jgi:hypothetical protein
VVKLGTYEWNGNDVQRYGKESKPDHRLYLKQTEDAEIKGETVRWVLRHGISRPVLKPCSRIDEAQ